MSKKPEKSTLTELTKDKKLQNKFFYGSITPQVDPKSQTKRYGYSNTKYLITTEAPKPNYGKLVYGDYGGFQKWWPKPKKKTRLEKYKDIVRFLATCPLSVDWDQNFISHPPSIVILNKNETLFGIIITNNFINKCIDL